MTDPKVKRNKPNIPIREPQKRTRAGTFDNLRQLPHPVEEILGLVDLPSGPPVLKESNEAVITDQSKETFPGAAHTPSTPRRDIAPSKDFTRVANSIVREAMAGGLFQGKSKQLYDFLYSQTRGAIIPKRSICIPRDKLMKGADIGSDVTLTKNLAHLRSVGLIKTQERGGTHGGNEYTVFLPEEVNLTPPTPSREGTPPSPPRN